jgi:hypothetical protein
VMAFCSSVLSNGSAASAMRPRISAPGRLAAAAKRADAPGCSTFLRILQRKVEHPCR